MVSYVANTYGHSGRDRGRDTLAHTALAKALQAIDVLTLGVGV